MSFWGIESEPTLTPRGKSPLALPEAQMGVKPATLHHTGQQAQHTTHWPIPAHYIANVQATGTSQQSHKCESTKSQVQVNKATGVGQPSHW